MTYPNREEAVELIHKCGGKPDFGPATTRWFYLFVQNQDGAIIGRLTFEGNRLKYIRSYKKDYHREIDETDEIFGNLYRALDGKEILGKKAFQRIWERATYLVKTDLEEKLAWREANPSTRIVKDKNGKDKIKHRKKLQGRNPRPIFHQLVKDYKGDCYVL